MDAPGRPTSQGRSDWERQQDERRFEEGAVQLPPYPKPGDLIEFRPFGSSSLRFFIDRASIGIGPGAVRYTLVTRNASGTESASHEGIRCGARAYRLYALGQRDGTWKQVQTEWRDKEPGWSRVLRREFFCRGDVAIQTVEEGLEALRAGGHNMRRDAVNRHE